MRLFDVLGPVMTGPSAATRCGAIGSAARRLLGSSLREPRSCFTAALPPRGGHGTDRALVAGLLGMQPDDDHATAQLFYCQEAGLR